MRRKSKWQTHILEKWRLIGGWARDGLTDEEIAREAGVAYSTFRRYKNEHPELKTLLKKGKEWYDTGVVERLHERTEWTEKQVERWYKLKKITYDPKTGRRRKEEEILEMRYETQMTPPDTTAMIFWLTNRMPDKWKNKQDVRAEGEIGAQIKVALGNAEEYAE